VERVLALLAGLALAGSTSPAYAQETQVVAPPGNSGVQEYLEVVPGADGDRPAAPGGDQAAPASDEAGRTSPAPREVLGLRTARALSRLGPDGRDAAAVAAAGVPSDADAVKPGRAKTTSRSGSLTSEAERGGTEAVVGALSGNGGGMGLAFPLLLLAALATALALLAGRRAARRE
jgi:hypothetical protein